MSSCIFQVLRQQNQIFLICYVMKPKKKLLLSHRADAGFGCVKQKQGLHTHQGQAKGAMAPPPDQGCPNESHKRQLGSLF